MATPAAYTENSLEVIPHLATTMTAHFFSGMHMLFQPRSGSKLVGEGDKDKPICYKRMLEKGGGSEIRVQKLWDANIPFLSADLPLEGLESEASTDVYKFRLHHIRGGAQWKLLFDQQKVQHDILRHQVHSLGLSAAQHFYFIALGHLMGYRTGTKAAPVDAKPSSEWTNYQGRQIDFREQSWYLGTKPTVPDVDHHYRCGSFDVGSRITTDEDANVAKINLNDLKVLSSRVVDVEGGPPLRAPLKVGGLPFFPVALSSEMSRTLKEDSNYRQYVQDFAMQGGDVKNNVFFTGANFKFDRLVGFEIEKAPPGLNSTTGVPVTGTQRGVVLGNNAMYIASGKASSPSSMFFLVSGDRDGRQNRYWHAHMICGMGCPEWTNPHDGVKRDHGRIVFTSKVTKFKSL